MAQASIRERYPPPWTVDEIDGGFRVMSSNGFCLAWVYSRDAWLRGAMPDCLLHGEALAIAHAIARLAAPSNVLAETSDGQETPTTDATPEGGLMMKPAQKV